MAIAEDGFRLVPGPEPATLLAEGRLTFRTAGGFLRAIRPAFRASPSAFGDGRPRLRLRLGRLAGLDTSGVAVLLEAQMLAWRRGWDLVLEDVPEALQDAIRLSGIRLLPPEPPPRTAGERAAAAIDRAGGGAAAVLGYLRFLGACLAALVVAPMRTRGFHAEDAVLQMLRVGVQAAPLVGLICFLMGLTLSLQSAAQLQGFGFSERAIDLVALSMTREIGPLLAAVLVAGRSGSAITAEIGSMRVSEEIDALNSLGVSEMDHLVAPRLHGLLVMLPGLTLFADAAGILGGWFFCRFGLGMDTLFFVTWLFDVTTPRDILTGIGKSLLFALVVGSLAAFFGLRVRGGGEAVGQATTRAVVAAIVLILLGDAAATACFYYLGILS